MSRRSHGLQIMAACGILLLAARSFDCRAADAPASTETIIKLKVQPAPVSKPVSKYQLLPALREMNPGNPIPAYLKCFEDHKDFFGGKEEASRRQTWEKMPLDQLPLKELGNYGGEALQCVDAAARLDTPDWQVLGKAKQEGYKALLQADVASLRSLVLALKVRFRAQVAARHFEDALRTAKTLFALARHAGEHPTMLGALVGTAFAFTAIDPLEELIQQPGCPNLYWAITDLPSPLLDFRKAIEGERLFLFLSMPQLNETEPMTEGQLKQAVERVRELMKEGVGDAGGPKEDVADWLDARTKDEAHVRDARRRLVERGLAEDGVKKFPPRQVILLDEKFAYLAACDERLKGLALPHWQVEAMNTAAEPVKNGDTLFGRPGPSFFTVRRALTRLDQRLALLRHVEVLRLYAAENDGRLPARLDDVPLPLPLDPATGKSFFYKLDGQTVVLRGSPPGGEKGGVPGFRYEVTLGK